MADIDTILKGFSLSARELKSMHPDWSQVAIEDHLVNYDNLIKLAEYVIATIRDSGTIKPAHLPNAWAENDSIYYSTTSNKLVYKDENGNVDPLE